MYPDNNILPIIRKQGRLIFRHPGETALFPVALFSLSGYVLKPSEPALAHAGRVRNISDQSRNSQAPDPGHSGRVRNISDQSRNSPAPVPGHSGRVRNISDRSRNSPVLDPGHSVRVRNYSLSGLFYIAIIFLPKGRP